MSRALSTATPEELDEALEADRLPEDASTELRNGGVTLIHMGEERARREIDQRFAEVLTAVAERDRRIDALEIQVATLMNEGDEG